MIMPLIVLAGCVEFQIEDKDVQVEEPTIIEEIFEQSPTPKVDVLWVVDNTGSMVQEQQMLANGMHRFVEALNHENINWHAGIVTTDVSGNDAGVLQGTPWLITSNIDQAAEALQDAAHVGLLGHQPEAGLAAAVIALSPELKETNRGFRRDDAALHIVVFSDSDDDSESVLGPNTTERFLEFLDQQAIITGHSASFSAVVGASPHGCIGQGGTALPGTRYIDVVDQSGGTQGNICNADFESVMTVLASQSVEWKTRFTLQAEPDKETLRIQVNDQRIDTGWILLPELPGIEFNVAPEPDAEIRIRYEVVPQ
jgi:hypothetical protein